MSAPLANLPRVNEMLALADEHERRAVELASFKDAQSIAKAADHFIIADGLRGRARFAR